MSEMGLDWIAFCTGIAIVITACGAFQYFVNQSQTNKKDN